MAKLMKLANWANIATVVDNKRKLGMFRFRDTTIRIRIYKILSSLVNCQIIMNVGPCWVYYYKSLMSTIRADKRLEWNSWCVKSSSY